MGQGDASGEGEWQGGHAPVSRLGQQPSDLWRNGAVRS